MPVFMMVCGTCSFAERKLLKKPDEYRCDHCTDGKMQPQMPTSVNSTTMETKDPRRGKSLPKGHQQKMVKRMNEHHDSYEAARKIDEFGMNDALRLGWHKKVRRT